MIIEKLKGTRNILNPMKTWLVYDVIPTFFTRVKNLHGSHSRIDRLPSIIALFDLNTVFRKLRSVMARLQGYYISSFQAVIRNGRFDGTFTKWISRVTRIRLRTHSSVARYVAAVDTAFSRSNVDSDHMRVSTVWRARNKKNRQRVTTNPVDMHFCHLSRFGHMY